jgi:hypothetical protein
MKLTLHFILPFLIFNFTSAGEVNFNRDIKPLLSDRCFHCHGPDEESREAHLRLDIADTKEGAFRVRKGKAAIVPGKPKESQLYQRIMTDDEDDIMPPQNSHKIPLTTKEKALFKQWITEGAKWSKHWAFEKPVKPALPQVKNDKWANHPIDKFILAKLEKNNLTPTAQAPRYQLIRRLSYDLTGLPPTPAEVKTFNEDQSTNAYEKLVDKLLAKPAYGERMALPWLDMARYGDTSVYHADAPRTMWPWRDWVIKAYNNNKPFDQFTIEQIAGDHLKNRTLDQHIATAFLRNNGTTDEAGAFFEEYRVKYTVDRLSTVSQVWLGLTTACAQCHDHKYDPISQKEFYDMYAFFNIAADPGKQTRRGNQAPVAKATQNAHQLLLINILDKELAELKKSVETHKKSLQPEIRKWLEKEAKHSNVTIDLKNLIHFFPFSSQYATDDFLSSKLTKNSRPDRLKEVWGIHGKKAPKSKKLTAKTRAIEFNNFSQNYGQKATWIDSDTPFTASMWIKYNPQKQGQLLFGKVDEKAKMKGFEFVIQSDKLSFKLTSESKKNELNIETEKLTIKKKWALLTFSYDGKKKAAGVKVYVNGKPLKTKTLSDTLSSSIKNKSPFLIGSRKHLNLRSPLTFLQIYNKVLSPKEINASLKMTLQDFVFTKDNIVKKELATRFDYYYFNKINAKQKKLNKALAALQKKVGQAKGLNVMVMEDQKKPRKTYILNRGAYDQPKKDLEIFPGTPAVLHPMKKDYPKNRLGLAKWIVDEDNPLTARVTVNRYWMMLFSHGLVKTVDDFGNQGSWPTHPDLLDWLAVDFRENGWNVKRMLKQIVMSNTYRQSSNISPELLAKDKANKLYARGPRFRLTGEHIRDTALFVSGLLNPTIGGPSVKPYQPPGLWHDVSITSVRFVQDKGDKNFRKSIYTYYKRSAPVPNMVTFDAPSRENCIIERSRTNTPLQALVTLNDPIFVEAARFFAERIIMEGPKSIEAKIDFAFINAVARKPSSEIRQLIKVLYTKNLTDFKKDPKKSTALLAVGTKAQNASLNAAEHAAWTVIAQLVMNMDETLNKE